MLQRARHALPLLAALLLLGAWVGWDQLTLARLCHGEVPYGLDDSYIHLGLARNLVEHGSFGVSAGEVAPLSSSLLWTGLLTACLAVLGRAEWVAGALSLGAGVGAVLLADWHLRERSPWLRAGALAVLVAGAPLPAQVVLGMEHALHGLVALALVLAGARLLEGRGSVGAVALLAALACLARYEGLLLVGPLALALGWQRRWAPAAAILAAGALPLVLYGAWSAHHGWWWLPTGVVLKTGVAPAEPWLWPLLAARQAAHNLGGAPWVSALVGTGALLAVRMRDPALRLWIAGAVLHLLLSRTGEFTRYEAWIVIAGAPVVAAALPGAPRWAPWLALALVPGLAWRGWSGGHQVRSNAVHVWRHQVQVGRFLGAMRPGAVVATTEAGALSWYADARFVDLAGLASLEVARLMRSRALSSAAVEEISQREAVEIAPVFSHWMRSPEVGGLPPSWIPVAHWADPGGRPHPQGLTIYATSAEGADALWRDLSAWPWPPEVRVVRARR